MELAVRFKQVVKSLLPLLIREILCVCISMTKYNICCCNGMKCQVSLLTDVRTASFANPNKTTDKSRLGNQVTYERYFMNNREGLRCSFQNTDISLRYITFFSIIHYGEYK